MRSPYFYILFVLILSWSDSTAQSPIYRYMASDTIVTKKSFAGNVYLLNGKKMNLSVMSWFMSDFPISNDKIQIANMSNRLSKLGYTVGGIFFLAGALSYENNRPASKDFFSISGASIGGSLVLQMISNFFKKESVEHYNRAIIYIYKNGSPVTGVEHSNIGVKVTF